MHGAHRSGRTVKGRLVIDNVHRSVSDVSKEARRSWAARKVSSYLYVNVTARKLEAGEGAQHKATPVQYFPNRRACN